MPSPQRLRKRSAVLVAGCFLLPSAFGAAIDAVRPKDNVALFAAGWSQCGGYHYTGPTECEEGFICRKKHESYHQCFPKPTAEVTTAGIPQDIFTRPPPAAPVPTTPSLPPKTPEGMK